jgi:hypothetical protein
MNTILSRQPPAFKLSKLFWVGIGVFAVGSGPLLLVILFAALGLTKDPNPNPVGPGIMALLTFWPGLGLTLAGLARSVMHYREAKRQYLGRQSGRKKEPNNEP